MEFFLLTSMPIKIFDITTTNKRALNLLSAEEFVYGLQLCRDRPVLILYSAISLVITAPLVFFVFNLFRFVLAHFLYFSLSFNQSQYHDWVSQKTSVVLLVPDRVN